MLFNSYEFLLFLGVFLWVFYTVPTLRGRKLAVVLFSLFFYGWFYWPYLLLIGGSMAMNYAVGRRFATMRDARQCGWGLRAGTKRDLIL